MYSKLKVNIFSMNTPIFLFVSVTGVLLVLCCLQLKAQTVQTNGSSRTNIITGVPFLLIVPDARTGAMGDVGAATLPDQNASAINPSKLAYMEQPYGMSVSYSPWLSNLKAGINLAFLSAYYKIDERNTVGTSLRYLSLGEVQLFDANRQDLGTYSPNEFAFDVTYARKFGESFSLGTALRYIRSDLVSGQLSSGGTGYAGNAVAMDASAYVRKHTVLFGTDALLAFGLNISNIGTKIGYNDAGNKFFLPANIRFGAASTFIFNDLNQFTFALDLNKLLVPSQPVYDSDGKIISGHDPDVSVPTGIFSSFSDAPGGGSEELKELSIGTGLEYTYDKKIALRGGYSYENPQKGDRRYFTVGAGFKYQPFVFDLAYMIAGSQNNPLANTLRFTLTFSPVRK
ncbi:type IX secretion system outer membrane channel protein PorV [Pedobacter hiemivivus]|uniref:Type IX secretion system outer membrane channel protein PorV n=2 Tax=Pedobacter hiemivivus TaxID=2530454 RepID=A0A4U1G246_9SPHI|nr:type IX secretion system outer membrane channel protein PorV [Pedobacter hiemivivus]